MTGDAGTVRLGAQGCGLTACLTPIRGAHTHRNAALTGHLRAKYSSMGLSFRPRNTRQPFIPMQPKGTRCRHSPFTLLCDEDTTWEQAGETGSGSHVGVGTPEGGSVGPALSGEHVELTAGCACSSDGRNKLLHLAPPAWSREKGLLGLSGSEAACSRKTALARLLRNSEAASAAWGPQQVQAAIQAVLPLGRVAQQIQWS